MTDAELTSLLTFVVTAIVIELTPGPNMAYLAALALQFGARAGVAAVAGIAIGLAVYGLVAALGLAALIERSPIFYETLRWAGVAYLLWLAWVAWSSEEAEAIEAADGPASAAWTAFRRGLLTNLLNPKAGIFYVAVIPTFVSAEFGNVLTQTVLLSAVFVVIASSIHLIVVLLASRLHGFLSDPVRRRIVRRALAVALAAIAVWFAITTGR